MENKFTSREERKLAFHFTDEETVTQKEKWFEKDYAKSDLGVRAQWHALPECLSLLCLGSYPMVTNMMWVWPQMLLTGDMEIVVFQDLDRILRKS